MELEHKRELFSAVSIGAILFGSFALKRPEHPRWLANGPSLLEGKVFSRELWGRLSNYGLKGIVFGVFGYYFLSLARDHAAASDKSKGVFNTFLLTEGVTSITKRLVARQRPDRADNMSFFSGHASYVFSLALYLSLNILEEHDKDHPIIARSAVALLMGAATMTAISRSGAGRHYFSDVLVGSLVGAGIGLLNSSKTLWEGKSHPSKFCRSQDFQIV